ncbi:MAG: pilus (MSHA type) biogenesis protein MshL [Helicobacteraceae bacterium]|nr:pilus (MSHA type) biogenesis protein MshL [Helicobacteraceae bacterium]
MKALKALTAAFIMTATMYAACPGERFDVTIKEPIALKEALLAIIDECDLSLSLEGEGTQAQFDSAKIGYVTLRAVNAEEAADFFLQRANLHGFLVNDLLTIRYLDTRLFRVDFVNNSRSGSSTADVKIGTATGSSGSSDGSSSSDSTTTIKTEEKFDLWTTLEKEIGSVLSRPEDGAKAGANSVFVNPTSGIVTVTGTRRQVDRVSEYLDKLLNSLKKQVLIDVQIYEVQLDNKNTSGIDWSRLSLSIGNLAGDGPGGAGYDYTDEWRGSTDNRHIDKGFILSGKVRFDAMGMLDFLKKQGETRSLSNPKVLAMNNQPTLISVGKNINYQTLSSTTLSGSSSGSSTQSAENDSLFVGVLLDITPQIDDEGYITLRLNPSYSDLLRAGDEDPCFNGVASITGGNCIRNIAPDTKSHRISSVVRVRDNDIIVLGGLIDSSSDVQENKVPILGDIPFLGKLFGSKATITRNREIVFVLTPHVVVDDQVQPSLKALGYGEVMIDKIRDDQSSRAPKLKEFDDE